MSANLDPMPRSDECDVLMLFFLSERRDGNLFALFTTNAGVGRIHEKVSVYQQQIYAWSAAHGVKMACYWEVRRGEQS